MPKVSVIIPTHNRPELLKRALASVVSQSYQDFEAIVVDDGVLQRTDLIVASFGDPRIKYIHHETERGGSAARNTGIRAARGLFIAFLDDDDEWVPEKLAIQIGRLENTPPEVGFCFSAVTNVFDEKSAITTVPEGVSDYHARALYSFKTFLTVTLVMKRSVFDAVGLFDEQFPSHQEAELMIRVTQHCKGLGINRPLVKVNMKTGADQLGRNILKAIEGRKLILEKHAGEFRTVPRALAAHYLQLAIWYRDSGDFKSARTYFLKAFIACHRVRYLLHYLSLLMNFRMYNTLRRT